MNIKQILEDKLEETEKKMKELSLSMELLENEHQALLKELGLTTEELQNFAQNSENFSKPLWEQLQNEKKMLDEKLDLEMKNIRDPQKVKTALSEQSTIQNHWLFVR